MVLLVGHRITGHLAISLLSCSFSLSLSPEYPWSTRVSEIKNSVVDTWQKYPPNNSYEIKLRIFYDWVLSEQGKMGSRKCRSCLSSLLIPLALWSVTVNILLYFPNGQISYASSNKLTNYVWYFEGICFSGVMVSVNLETSDLRSSSFTKNCFVPSKNNE